MTRSAAFCVALTAALITIASCAPPPSHVTVFAPTAYPRTLSPWGVVRMHDRVLELGVGVVPYDLASPLFSDYAHKLRTVWLPPGESASYADDDVFEFPVGSVISKTFFFPRMPGATDVMLATEDPVADTAPPGLDLDEVVLVETRLLVRQPTGWDALVYVWNSTQDEALLEIAGDAKALRAAMPGGGERTINYLVPTRNDCANCHTTHHTTRSIEPIGLAARHLDKTYSRYSDGAAPQLDRWERLGILKGRPETARATPNALWQASARDDLEHRARSYLDINCGHCHNPHGAADTSGLFLHSAEASPRRLGFCKPTVAAGRGAGGRSVSIAPGEPDASILTFRLESTDPAAMMPELGRTVVHTAGASLIHDWIASLEGSCS